MTRVDPDCSSAAMPRCRPFKLVDAMILTSATAVWMTWMRPQWNGLQFLGMLSGKGIPWWAYVATFYNAVANALIMLAAAYLVMRLIPPRPSMSDLIRQPGMLFLGLVIAPSILLMLLSAFGL